MSARRFAAWGFYLCFAVLGALAFVGDRLLGLIYTATMVPVLMIHTFYLCPRCENVFCALNPRSPEHILRRRTGGPEPTGSFSDLPSTWAAAMMGVSAGIGFVGAWRASPWAALALAALAAPVLVIYFRTSCRFCTNRCVANANPAYRDWRAAGAGGEGTAGSAGPGDPTGSAR